MPKTVQIRDIDDDVYAALKRHAAFLDMSVPEFLRREVTRVAERETMEEWLARVSRKAPSNITTKQVNDTLDELRGPWPDAGR